ncbi:GNAT family N-acetyltransferase [Proteiniclasticum sp. C24MP]|uniref:GNAT family N-acetyltransferase n=1 Tax=Proteiniclasticum sp. C24MP TaxID=3374101 RepID=UPI00375477AE
MVLETKRLYIRRFEEKDLADFNQYASDPEVGPSAGWKPHESMKESEEILEGFMKSADIFAMEHKKDGRVIGSLGLHEDRKRDYKGALMLGYAMGKDYWGQGLMTEAVDRLLQYAFSELDMKIISAYHYPFNQRSKRVLVKAGFSLEGTLKMASALYDGQVVDDVCYAITREEYEKSREKSEDQI